MNTVPKKSKTIAVIGAGFSGSLTAIHLSHLKTSIPLTIYLIDSRGTFGPGLAYSPPSDRFKLNVRAKAMGAFADDPQGFFRWLKEREPQTSPDDFVSRLQYGRYLSELVEQAAATPGNNPIHRVHDKVTDLSYDSAASTFTVTLRHGEPLVADACVLAIGNLMKGSLSSSSEATIFREPFNASSYSDLSKLSSLLIIGSSLTAVDVIIEAEARGFKGSYTVVSRNGRFPRTHEEIAQAPSVSLPSGWERSGSVRALVKLVRRESQRLSSSQPVIDVMRPHLQEMWSNLSTTERRRFLRHVRPFWEIHRHRIPREHAAVLERLKDSGRLTILAGRVVSTERTEPTISARISIKGSPEAQQTVIIDAAFLCAGPEGELERASPPLVHNLLAKGFLATGPLKIGAVVPESPATSAKTPRLWLLGPLQREQKWEITAVRELREEAKKVAQGLATTLFKNSTQ